MRELDKEWQGSHWIRTAKRLRIYARDKYKCIWCEAAVSPRTKGSSREGKIASLDHIKPRSQGGTNEHHNLITSCLSCNDERGDSSYIEFIWDLAWKGISSGDPSGKRQATIKANSIFERLVECLSSDLPKAA